MTRTDTLQANHQISPTEYRSFWHAIYHRPQLWIRLCDVINDTDRGIAPWHFLQQIIKDGFPKSRSILFATETVTATITTMKIPAARRDVSKSACRVKEAAKSSFVRTNTAMALTVSGNSSKKWDTDQGRRRILRTPTLSPCARNMPTHPTIVVAAERSKSM